MGMLIWVLFVASICRNEAHEEVWEIAELAMEELGKLIAKMQSEAEPFNFHSTLNEYEVAISRHHKI